MRRHRRATRAVSTGAGISAVGVALVLIAACGGSSSKAGTRVPSKRTDPETTSTTVPALDVDSITWTRKTGGLPDAGNLNGLVAWKDSFVAVGVDSTSNSVAIWSSSDGLDWTKVSVDSKIFQANEFPADIATNGDVLVIAGFKNDGQSGRPRAWTSTDGKTWKRAAASAFPSDAAGFFTQIDGNSDGFVALFSGKNEARVATSTDGETWTLHAADIGGSDDSVGVDDAILTPSGYLAVGSAGEPADGAVWTSADGDTWKRAASPVLGGARFQAANTATNGGPGFVVAGAGNTGSAEFGAIWSSADGNVWKLAPQTAALFGGRYGSGIDAIANVNGKLLAVGHASGGDGRHVLGIWTSADGTKWKRVAAGPELSDSNAASVTGLAATSKAVVALARLQEFDVSSGRFVTRDLGVYVGT
jgi:hypothetical protein